MMSLVDNVTIYEVGSIDADDLGSIPFVDHNGYNHGDHSKTLV